MNIALRNRSASGKGSGSDSALWVAAGVLLALCTLILLAAATPSHLARFVVFAFTLAGAFAAWVAAWQGRTASSNWWQGWTLIGLGFLARSVHYGLVIALPAQAERSAAEFLRPLAGCVLILQPLLLWGGLQLLMRGISLPERLTRAIDSLLIGGSVLALAWWLAIEPALVQSSPAALGQVSRARLLTAPGNAAALALALLWALRTRQGSTGIWLLGGAAAALAAADFLYLRSSGGAQPAGTALLAGTSSLLIILSALSLPEPGEPEAGCDVASRLGRVASQVTKQDVTGERWNNTPFPNDSEVCLGSFQQSRRELSLRWMTGAVVIMLPALATLAGIYHLTQPHANAARMAPGELWWAPLLVCLAAVRHAVISLRNTERMGVLLAHASAMQQTIAARTHQLTALYATTADLSNAPDQELLLTTALERMLEAVRADAGAVWLRADYQFAPAADQDRRGMGTLQPGTASSLFAWHGTPGTRRSESSVTKQAAFLRRPDESQGGERPPRWRLIRSKGECEGDLQVLRRMDELLERGGLSHCAHLMESEHGGTGSACVTAIRWKEEVVGAAGIVCRRDEISVAEKKLLEALGMEVGAALQNVRLYLEARRRADLDGVTGLFNHRTIQEHLCAELEKARASGRPLTIVMMDLNNFKFFNDTYGHPVGDKVLRIVAHCLRETCRTEDVIGRYGGDEFVALLPDTDARGALEVCSRVAARVEEEAWQDSEGRRIPIGLSFGASVFPHDGNSALDLLSVADANLYEAKRGGAPLNDERASSSEPEEIRQLKDMGTGGSFGILDALVTAIDNKDHYTRRHSEDVTHWAVLMARELEYSSDTQRAVRICGLLHDVGKIAMPDAILRQPGRLSDDEFQIMQQHPVFGALIVKDVPNLNEVLDGIRHHHERYDGKGYPDRLKGENIPLLGRLLAIPDCFSAMTTARPYRPALPWNDALQEIIRGRGSQFDPVMADAFVDLVKRTLHDENNASFDKSGGRQSVLQAGGGLYGGDGAGFDSAGKTELVNRPRSVADAELSAD